MSDPTPEPGALREPGPEDPQPAVGAAAPGLDRRPRKDWTPRRGPPPALRTVGLPSPGPLLLLQRCLRLVWGGLLYLAFWGRDLARGRGGSWARAERVREVVVRLGGNAPRLAEELAQRIDVIPYEVYYALSMTQESAPALPLEVARGAVERSTGRPLEEDFEVFDPTPIVSDAVSCVYQAVLRGGDRVAVRLLRPDIRRIFAADIAALSIGLSALELLTVVRPGSLRHLADELRQMVAEDLDLYDIARFHRLFRKYTRRAGLDWLTAVRVYPRFTSEELLVTEFVSGVWMDEILGAVDSGDPAAQDWLRDQGIDRARLGRRVLEGAWWSVFEAPLFQGAPRAQSIVVQPGDRLVFVTFRDCGGVSDRRRGLARQVLDRLSRKDVSGASEAVIQLLAPLPFIEVAELAKALEARLWHQLFLMEDRESPWIDATSIGVWIAVLDVAWEYKVPVRQEVVRMLRCFVLFDAIGGRIRPELRLFHEFERYLARADRRVARALRRDVERTSTDQVQAQLLARVRDGAMLLDRLRFFVGALTERVPVQFHSLSGKAAYAVSTVLNVTLLAAAGVIGVSLLVRVRYALTGERFEYDSLPEVIAAHPLPFNVALAVLLLITVRRIGFRLEDKEQD